MCLKGRDFKRNEGYVHERDRKRKGHDAICYGRCIKCKQNLVLKHLLAMHKYMCVWFLYRCDPWGLYFTFLAYNQQSFSSFFASVKKKIMVAFCFLFQGMQFFFRYNVRLCNDQCLQKVVWGFLFVSSLPVHHYFCVMFFVRDTLTHSRLASQTLSV